MAFLKRKKYEVVLKKLSQPDLQTLDKLDRDFVQTTKRPDKTNGQDSADTQDQSFSGDEFDVNEFPSNPKLQKEAGLKLKFGKLKSKKDDPAPENLFTEYADYFSSGKLEYFQAKDGLVFGFIPLQTFRDSLNFEVDWKVRFIALEEIYLLLAKQTGPKSNDVLWNVKKFVYVQLNGGVRMDFLDSAEIRKKKTLLLSVSNFNDGFQVVSEVLILRYRVERQDLRKIRYLAAKSSIRMVFQLVLVNLPTLRRLMSYCC